MWLPWIRSTGSPVPRISYSSSTSLTRARCIVASPAEPTPPSGGDAASVLE